MRTVADIVAYLQGVAHYYRSDAEQCRELSRRWRNRLWGTARLLRRSAEDYETIAEAIDRMIEEIQR